MYGEIDASSPPFCIRLTARAVRGLMPRSAAEGSLQRACLGVPSYV